MKKRLPAVHNSVSASSLVWLIYSVKVHYGCSKRTWTTPKKQVELVAVMVEPVEKSPRMLGPVMMDKKTGGREWHI